MVCSQISDTLNEDWAQSKNFGYRTDNTVSKDTMERQARTSERAARKRNRQNMEMLNEGSNVEIENNSSSACCEKNASAVETQTTLSKNDIVIMKEEVKDIESSTYSFNR